MSKTIRKHKDLKHAKLNKQVNEVSHHRNCQTRKMREFDEDGENESNYRRNYYNEIKKKSKGKIKTKEKQLVNKKLDEYYEDI